MWKLRGLDSRGGNNRSSADLMLRGVHPRVRHRSAYVAQTVTQSAIDLGQTASQVRGGHGKGFPLWHSVPTLADPRLSDAAADQASPRAPANLSDGDSGEAGTPAGAREWRRAHP